MAKKTKDTESVKPCCMVLKHGDLTSRLDVILKGFLKISCFNSPMKNLKIGNRNLRHPIP